MAVDFVQPTSAPLSSTFLARGSAVAQFSELPICFFIPIKPTANNSNPINRKLISIVNDPREFGGADSLTIGLESDPGSAKRVFCQASHTVPEYTSYSTTSWADQIGQWQYVGGNVTGSLAACTVKVYHNGVAGPTDSGSFPFIRTFENTYIGAYPTVTVGSYNGGCNMCWEEACIWVGVELSDADHAFLAAGGDPTTIHPSNLYRIPGLDADSVRDAYFAGVQEADWTLSVFEASGGSVATCVDSPSSPDPIETGEVDECGAEDEADALSTAITWPKCVLIPQRISVDVISPTVSSGRSFTSREQIVQPDAGRLHVTLFDVPIRTRAHVLQWREIETFLKGRNGSILVPLYEGKLSDTPIVATVSGDHGIGAAVLDFQQDDGEGVVAGMHFSIGERAYRVKSVITQETGGATRISFVPPLREAVESGADMNFNDPACRCVLATDAAMNINLELLRYSTPTVEFREDV